MYWTYPIYKDTYAANIAELYPFMFSLEHRVINEKDDIIVIQKEEPKKPNPSPFDKCRSRLSSVKRCQDPLFWSIYLAKFGKKEYDRVGLSGNEEMKEKMAKDPPWL
jgi:hypothetical protein